MNNKMVSKTLDRKKKKLIFYTLMIAYPLLQFCIFYIGVNINSVLLAFKEYNYGISGGSAGYSFAGFKQFALCLEKFQTEPALSASIGNSLITYLISTVVSSSLALFFAFYIHNKKFAATFFRLILFLPSVISPLVMAIMFNNFAEEALPMLLEQWFGIDCPPLLSDPSIRFGTLQFYSVWVGFGTSVLLYNSSMAAIDVSVLEAAKLDGAVGFKEFLYVVFPLIFSTFSTFFIVGVATIFTNQLNLYSFFGDQASASIYTFGYYLYKYTARASISDYPWLSAMGLMMTVVAVVLTFTVKWLLKKFGPSVD